MGNGVPLIREPTSSEELPPHPPEYVIIDEDFRQALQIDHVDNTSDYDKPISFATQQALNNLVLTGGGTVPYTHTQASALTTWFIPHNLARRPIVQVFTSGWVEVLAQVINTDTNNTQIIFDTPQAGFAVLI